MRLAPCTGCRGAFRAHFGPLRLKTARNGTTAVSWAGRPESGFRGHFCGVPPPGFGGFHTLLRPKVRLAPRTGRLGAFGAHFGPLRAKTARNEKTAVSRARRPESGFRGHFSRVPPPWFGGFHTFLRPQSASSTPYRCRSELGQIRPETGPNSVWPLWGTLWTQK